MVNQRPQAAGPSQTSEQSVRTQPALAGPGCAYALRNVLALLLLTLLPGVALADFVASVDRNRIDADESVQVRFTYRGTTGNGTPDFAALETDFRLLGPPSHRREYQNINGRASSSQSWTVALAPRRRGSLVIPSINFAGERSAPISITVTAVPDDVQTQVNAMVFYETNISDAPHYVQAQILYERRLYYTDQVQLYGDLPEAPVIDNAVVTPLGTATPSNEIKNGLRYGVITQKFAVFPQRSGPLSFASASVQGSVRIRSGNRIVRRAVRVRAPEVKLDVAPKPPQWPAGVPWLPARALTLAEELNVTGRSIEAGAPLVRTITVSAQGLPGSSIPEFAPEAPAHTRSYTDAPAITDTVQGDIIVGRRIENTTIVPTNAGSLVLPGFELTWFDLDTQQVRTERLRVNQFQVTGDLQPPGSGIGEPPAPTEVVADSTSTSPVMSGQPPANHLWTWVLGLVALICAAGWGLTARRLARGPEVAVDAAGARQASSGGSRQRWQALLAACSASDARAARATLAAYWEAEFDDAQLVQLRRDPDGQTLLTELDAALYGRPSTSDDIGDQWDGDALADWLQTHAAPGSRSNQSSEPMALPPLYPAPSR